MLMVKMEVEVKVEMVVICTPLTLHPADYGFADLAVRTSGFTKGGGGGIYVTSSNTEGIGGAGPDLAHHMLVPEMVDTVQQTEVVLEHPHLPIVDLVPVLVLVT